MKNFNDDRPLNQIYLPPCLTIVAFVSSSIISNSSPYELGDVNAENENFFD